MKNSTLPPRISQAPQSQKAIYFTIKNSKQGLTRSYLAKATNYAITTTRDALQALAKKGLIYYNKILRCWCIRVIKQKIEDLYDTYIKFKKDWKNFISKVGGKKMTKMKWKKIKQGIDKTPEPFFVEEYSEIKVPYTAKPKRSLKYELAKDKRREQTLRTSPYYIKENNHK